MRSRESMHRGLMSLTAIFAFLSVGIAPAIADLGSPPAPTPGQPAPAFDLQTVGGAHVTLAGLRGKTVVVNVWATWCPPCQQETADLVAAHKQLAAEDVAFVSVDSTERPALVKAFAAAKNITWTQTVDTDQAFVKAYDVRYFPTTYVIDPDGVLRVVYIDVITPKLLARFVADAKARRNARLSSPLQDKIDALLAPSRYSFTGGDAQVIATVEQVSKTLHNVDGMADDSDPAKGITIDLPRTQAEENALRTAAIAALEPRATTDAQKLALNLLKGDADSYDGDYRKALTDYHAALALDTKNIDALHGISYAARRLRNYDAMLDADRTLAAVAPDSVSSWVGLGVDSGFAGKFADARTAFDRAVSVAQKKADAFGATSTDIRYLAWAHLYYGRMEAKAGRPDAARRQFALATQTTLRLPKTDERYSIYLEQAQEETVALDLGNRRTTAALSFAPWTGPELPGSSPGTAKYRLVVTGSPGRTIALQATNLPKGWIASFCADRICAPLHDTTTLPSSGVKIIEFQVVPPDAKSLAHVPSVRVIATDGKWTTSAQTIALR
jgi:cytochrome c biogenesis protein CcmG/thiol:disulfide interchange protein DsbE